jgi:hypothetical protein
LRQETGEQEGIAAALEGLAAVAEMQGQPVRAARLHGFAASQRTLLGAPLPPIDRPAYEQTVAALRAQLDEPSFLNAWTAGQAMTLEEALVEAAQVRPRAHLPPLRLSLRHWKRLQPLPLGESHSASQLASSKFCAW